MKTKEKSVIGEGKLDYLRDSFIDPLAIDVAWLRQANLFGRYATVSAKYRKKMDDLKEANDILWSKKSDKLRRDLTEKGEKFNESIIADRVRVMPEIVESVQKLNRAKFLFELSKVAVSTMEHKKTSLENLVRLMYQEYFAKPLVPRNLGVEWEKVAKDKLRMFSEDEAISKLNRPKTKKGGKK